jgi:hypothetical protein
MMKPEVLEVNHILIYARHSTSLRVYTPPRDCVVSPFMVREAFPERLSSFENLRANGYL